MVRIFLLILLFLTMVADAETVSVKHRGLVNLAPILSRMEKDRLLMRIKCNSRHARCARLANWLAR